MEGKSFVREGRDELNLKQGTSLGGIVVKFGAVYNIFLFHCLLSIM